jgi:hypothetical protein
LSLVEGWRRGMRAAGLPDSAPEERELVLRRAF